MSRICRLSSIQRIWGRLLQILTVFRRLNFHFYFLFNSFCYHLLGGTCEKCQKFFTLGEDSPAILKSTDIWSVFAHFNCPSTKGIFKRNFFIQLLFNHLASGTCETCQKFLVLSRICRLTSIQRISGRLLLILTVFRQLNFLFYFFINSFCYHLLGGAFEKSRSSSIWVGIRRIS